MAAVGSGAAAGALPWDGELVRGRDFLLLDQDQIRQAVRTDEQAGPGMHEGFGPFGPPLSLGFPWRERAPEL